MDERMDVRMGEYMDGWMGGWTGGRRTNLDSLGKTQFSVGVTVSALRRQCPGNNPRKDNSAPMQDIHKKDPSLVALGKNLPRLSH